MSQRTQMSTPSGRAGLSYQTKGYMLTLSKAYLIIILHLSMKYIFFKSHQQFLFCLDGLRINICQEEVKHGA